MSLQNTAVLPHVHGISLFSIVPYILWYMPAQSALYLIAASSSSKVNTNGVLCPDQWSPLPECVDTWICRTTLGAQMLPSLSQNRHVLATVFNLYPLLVPNLFSSLMTQLPSMTWLNLLTQTTLQQMKLGNMVAAKGAFHYLPYSWSKTSICFCPSNLPPLLLNPLEDQAVYHRRWVCWIWLSVAGKLIPQCKWSP